MNKSKVFDYILQLEDGIQSLLKDNPIKDMLVFEIINGSLIFTHELDASNFDDERTAQGVVELVIKTLFTKDTLMNAFCKHVNCYNTFGIGNKNKYVHNIDRETKYLNEIVRNKEELDSIKNKLNGFVNSFEFVVDEIKPKFVTTDKGSDLLAIIGRILVVISIICLIFCYFRVDVIYSEITNGVINNFVFFVMSILGIVAGTFILKIGKLKKKNHLIVSHLTSQNIRTEEKLKKKYAKMRDALKEDFDQKALTQEDKLKKEFAKIQLTITNDFNQRIRVQETINDDLNRLLKTKKPFSQLACMVADYETSIFKKDEHYLRYKPRPAIVSADKVREMREILAENVAECKQMLYKYEFLLSVFPELHDYIEDEEALISISDYTTISEINDNRDRVLDWISENDYRTMSVDERNQLALDRYKNRTKSNWEIGIDYELYVGYLLREGKHPFNLKYHVLQYGELNGLSDLGRDIIAERAELDGSRTILIIQCKRWSEQKVVHENAICQLYGTTVEYKIRHRNIYNCKFTPVFITTTELSDMAKEFAKYLGVVVYIISMGEYPMIKCNINGGEKIYHLPFDQQYHRTEIKNEGEFYASTVKEATSRGFRRAMKHFIN